MWTRFIIKWPTYEVRVPLELVAQGGAVCRDEDGAEDVVVAADGGEEGEGGAPEGEGDGEEEEGEGADVGAAHARRQEDAVVVLGLKRRLGRGTIRSRFNPHYEEKSRALWEDSSCEHCECVYSLHRHPPPAPPALLLCRGGLSA